MKKVKMQEKEIAKLEGMSFTMEQQVLNIQSTMTS